MPKYFAEKPKSIIFYYARDHNAFRQNHEPKLVVMKALSNTFQEL